MIGDIEGVLDALDSAHVRYLVVGGVAVVLHGYLRATADLDLVLHLERENVLRAVEALTSLGYRPRAPVDPRAFAEPETRQRWVRERNLMVFSLWSDAHPGFEVDIFVEEPFDFEAVYGRSLRVPLERIEASVISLEDLIALKRGAGRPLDLEDIAALEALRNQREDDHGRS